jgi:hypothetical protein
MPTATRPKQSLPGSDPSLVTLPDVTVAYIHTTDDPSEVGPEAMKALYGAAYGLKFALKKQGKEMQLGAPRARFNWSPGNDPGSTLIGDWAIVVPDDTREEDIPQKSERFPVRLARWSYGECAWIMHAGPYDAETPTIDRLAAFVDEQGRVITGTHEEWYLSPPSAKVPKTVILYPVGPGPRS